MPGFSEIYAAACYLLAVENIDLLTAANNSVNLSKFFHRQKRELNSKKMVEALQQAVTKLCKSVKI